MSLRTLAELITNLTWPSDWKVYPLDQAPQKLSTAKLPMLAFVEGQDGSGGDFGLYTFNEGSFEANYPALTHWLIYKPTTLGLQGKSPIIGDMIDFLDTYLTVARTCAPLFGSSNSYKPPKVMVGKLTVIPEGEGEQAVNYYARPFVWQFGEYL